MAAELPLAIKAILANYNKLDGLQAKELMWLLSLEKLEPQATITTKTLPGFITAVELFREHFVFHLEAPSRRYRDFMWSPQTHIVRVEYRDNDLPGVQEVNYYNRSEFVRIWSW